MRIPAVRILLKLLLITQISWNSSLLFAQNYSFDARKIALGGVANAGAGNTAFDSVPKRFKYGSLVIPFGLIQVFKNLDAYDPDKPDFDYVRMIDYAGNPFHYTFNRSVRGAGSDFLADTIHGKLSRDLNSYRGTAPSNEYVAEGLIAPNWGHTFKFAKNKNNNSYQGIFVGAGPYVALGTDLNFDQQLINILGNPQKVTIPQTTFRIQNTFDSQAALAVTGGYRAKFPLSGKTNQTNQKEPERNGIYVTADFHYLRGFRYDAIDSSLRIDTGADGLIAAQPATTPMLVNQLTSTSGNGVALDLGIAVVMSDWEFGLSVDGVGNRIKWNNPKQRQFSLSSLVSGLDFVQKNLAIPSASIQVELPVRYLGAIGYHQKSWSAMADLAYGFEKYSLHGGVEYRFSRLAFRGGGRYSRQRWQPSGGLGIDISKRVSIDVAAFADVVNVEKVREPSLAVSLRFNPAKF